MSVVQDKMLSMHPAALVKAFIDSYVYFHGEKKTNELAAKILSSPKIQNYIRQILILGLIPNPKEVGAVLNSVTYFIFSKAETLCLGGLSTILNCMLPRVFDGYYDELACTAVLANYILLCDGTKIHNKENVFTRFFREVSQMSYQSIADLNASFTVESAEESNEDGVEKTEENRCPDCCGLGRQYLCERCNSVACYNGEYMSCPNCYKQNPEPDAIDMGFCDLCSGSGIRIGD